jgi:hypothetical protein
MYTRYMGKDEDGFYVGENALGYDYISKTPPFK